MFYRFGYEAEFYPALSRVPLHARMKLDLTGIKISLKDWLALSVEERTVLCHLPIDTDDERQAFCSYLDFLSNKYRGTPVTTTDVMNSSLWDPSEVPDPVLQKSAGISPAITLTEWTRWQDHERYALYKTAVSKSQPEAFESILNELRSAKNCAQN
ncbi:MAG TPA: nitrate reductase associated protein [Verrucomicrobiae bacterium]|nr:nitrate reductase associated protein [Verrucomicrobiae bacterium]